MGETELEMKTEEWRLPCTDGIAIAASAWLPPAPHAVLVVAPAMGVPRQYYRRFAAALAAQHIAVAVFDYRGMGDSGIGDPAAARLEDWGRLDLQRVLVEAAQRHPGAPLFVAGHSCGGQVAGLAPLSEQLAGLILVASSTAYRGHWRGVGRWMITLWTHGIIPVAARGRWFPARRLGFSTLDVPSGVMRQWGAWARSPRHLFTPEHGIDTGRYRRLTCAGLSLAFADDSYAPRRAVRALQAEYPGISWQERHVKPVEVGQRAIGHMGFFKEALRETLWTETARWILQVAGDRARAAGAAA